MQKVLKRIIDVTVSLMGLIALFPICLLAAVVIKFTSPGPVFFMQDRAGENGEIFRLCKFRTMTHGAEEKSVGRYISEKEELLTPVGKFLRRWAVDELPQLWNVIKGDMSLVGPRPTLPYQIAMYSEFQRRRLDSKPGITGWAQVNGRNVLSWPERIELDLWYVDNWSIWLDLKVMIMTIPALTRKEFAFAREDAGNDEIVSFTQQKDL